MSKNVKISMAIVNAIKLWYIGINKTLGKMKKGDSLVLIDKWCGGYEEN